jgi:hypothetical protein
MTHLLTYQKYDLFFWKGYLWKPVAAMSNPRDMLSPDLLSESYTKSGGTYKPSILNNSCWKQQGTFSLQWLVAFIVFFKDTFSNIKSQDLKLKLDVLYRMHQKKKSRIIMAATGHPKVDIY